MIEGELPPRKSPLIPGHQVVGTVAELGEGAHRFQLGARVGIAWLHHTDQVCEYCRRGMENLCNHRLSPAIRSTAAMRSTRLRPRSGFTRSPNRSMTIKPRRCSAPESSASVRYGFRRSKLAASWVFTALAPPHIWPFRWRATGEWKSTPQHAISVISSSRSNSARSGPGGTTAEPPVKLDSAIIFAPAGEIVPAALKALRKGGVLALGGIHMSTIPPLDYRLLYQERVVRSVTNNTREDGAEFLRIAAEIPIQTQVQVYPLREANRALNSLKNDAIRGAAVLDCT